MGVFRGHTVTTRADKISNFSVSTAEYGAVVPEVLGTARLSGNVIYYDDFTAHEHRTSQRVGKGGHSKQVSITYTYTVACILALCEGPVRGIGKVWVGKDVYAYPDERIGMTLFSGEKDQKPWAYTLGKHPDKALPYTGLAYMAGVIDLGDSGSLPNYNFEVRGRLTETGDGVDVNPADYILYVLGRVGMGHLKISGMDNFRNYCREADLLISTPSDDMDAKTARDIVNEIATLCNAYVFWSNDRFKIVPRADRPAGDWQPNRTILYDLTPDDFIEQSGGACVTYSRKDSSEVYNRFSVEFLSRENGYEKETVTYEDAADIAEHGVRQAPTVKAHYLYTKKRAVMAAAEAARRNKEERNKYTFRLDWAFCCLEVGDLVTLTDPSIGMEKQVVMIDSVVEDANGLLTFTAVERENRNYEPALYDVHEADRPWIDFNRAPGPIDRLAIFQPPADLTTNGLELWIGAKGKTANWGGCEVFVSDDNEHYRSAGKISNSARIGVLEGDLGKDGGSLVVKINGTFLSGKEQDAERGNTLCWADGECFSYTKAVLIGEGEYRLEGLHRGQYNTTPQRHPAGTVIVRCDETILKTPFRKADVGKKIWLKFPSYNIFGSGEQSLSEVEPYEYTLTAYYIPPCTDITARNRYRELSDGVSRYDIVVDWTPPELSSYLEGEVWYKTNHGQAEALPLAEGVKADDLGFQGKWTFGGSGKNEVVIPQAIVGDTYRIAVCTKDEWGESESPDLVKYTDILVAIKTEIPNTPDGFSITFGQAASVSWKEVTNADIACYEIRSDRNPGAETPGLLARTNGLQTAVTLREREGTLYLYACSATGKYSAPAKLSYYKEKPPAPKPPRVKSKLGGLSIAADPIPDGANGMTAYINDTAVHSVNNTISYLCDAGIYDITVAYTDIFGEGDKSGASRAVVKTTVDASLIEDGAISMKKMDQTVTGTLDALRETDDGLKQTTQELSNTITKEGTEIRSQIKQQGDQITSVVADLNETDPEKFKYSALVQLKDSVEARVASKDFNGEEIVSRINLSPAGTTIDGKLLHVTGDTIIDKNVVVKGLIEAHSITADKLAVDSLSAITATIGTLQTKTSGARTVIKDNLIEVYDENNVLRVRMGVW